MRKGQFILMLTGIGFLVGMVYSCQKEIQDEQGQILKTARIDVALSPKEQLGKFIFFDKISVPGSMACADCHASSVGFTGPIVGINIHGSVYRGANGSFGNRKPPSAAYATFSPILHVNPGEIFQGGNFWDGRATGERLGSPSAEQALGPFLNPAEQNNPDLLTVLKKIAASKYSPLWEVVWGEPLSYDSYEKINTNYDRVGYSIAAYEASSEVNQFSSKFDYYQKGKVDLSDVEKQGLELFNDKGKCASCHISTKMGDTPPLFTDYTFDNLGVPINPENPFYKYFPDFIDKGLGGYLASRVDFSGYADANMGKHKIPTLRNVDKRPGNGFTKAYMHNGVFKSLKEVVHFYNTRDVEIWPKPEIEANINKSELGNLGLTNAEEDAIVAFMKTLSDGFAPPK